MTNTIKRIDSQIDTTKMSQTTAIPVTTNEGLGPQFRARMMCMPRGGRMGRLASFILGAGLATAYLSYQSKVTSDTKASNSLGGVSTSYLALLLVGR